MTAQVTVAPPRSPYAARRHLERFLTATDLEVMRPRLRGVLGSGTAETCAVLDAKFEPGRDAVVLYRYGEHLVHGTVPADPTAAPGAGVRLVCYPDDPALPGLPAVVDPAGLARTIEVGHLDSDVTVLRARSELLRYRPGRRATFLVEADLRRAGVTTVTRLVAKVYHDPGKAAAVAEEARVLRGGAPAEGLVLAPVVAHAPHRAVVVQEHLPGRPLVVDLGRSRPATQVDDLRRAARAVAALHRLSVPAGRRRPVEAELRRFVTRSTGIRDVDHATGDRLLDLAHRLLALPRPGHQISLVHGDCKPSQFLVQEQAVALLDLDHCGLADPAYDVGNLLATLRQHAVQRTPAALETALRLGDEFAEAYLQAAPQTRPAELWARIDFYAAVALTRKALRAFAKAPRSSVPLRFVDEAHRGLDHPRGD
jgi:aminoglycoside phosphotransferase (APT) family kinase protein